MCIRDRRTGKAKPLADRAVNLRFIRSFFAQALPDKSHCGSRQPIAKGKGDRHDIHTHLMRDVYKRQISCYAEGPSICCAFEDSGEGVPSSQLSQIFDPLFTSDAGRSVAGLGLSICREILQSHGGKIWAEPRKNRPGLCIRCV